MANYKLYRVDVAVHPPTVGGTKACSVTLEDTDTRTFVTVEANIPTTAFASTAAMKAWICSTYNMVYTPNDFGCS